MTLIVEDGSIVTGAESLVDVAYADTYFLNRLNSDWGALDVIIKEGLLRISTDYLTKMYREKWAGYRRSYLQNLDWPRSWVPIWDVISAYGPAPNYIAYNVIPDLVKNAVCEIAARHMVADNYKLLTDLELREKTVKVGSIQIEYDMNAPKVTIYREIDAMLTPFFVRAGSGNVSIYRA
jgi:hypothetical protein